MYLTRLLTNFKKLLRESCVKDQVVNSGFEPGYYGIILSFHYITINKMQRRIPTNKVFVTF